MAGTSVVRDRLDRDRVRYARRAVVEVLFGDRTGVVLFCGVLAFFVVTWRVGRFITDIELFGTMLVGLADGSLALGEVGDVGSIHPGMHRVDDTVYGRNYGQVVASLPAYWLVETVGPVAFHWLVVVGWSGLVAVVAAAVGDHLGHRRAGVAVGATVGLVAAAVNAAEFPSVTVFASDAPFVALQVTAMVVAATTAVTLYRLVARQSGPALGVLAGSAVAVATPVGFWATVPKRHAFTAAFVVVALYALVRSREDTAGARLGQAGFRAVAYASAGLLTWVHAPEGFTLFLAVALVDLPTAPRNDRRTLAVIACGFALSLVPFFVTNYLISGNPVYPPRLLDRYTGQAQVVGNVGASAGGVEGGGAGSGGSSTNADGGWNPLAGLEPLLPTALFTFLQRGLFQYVDGVAVVGTDPGRLVTVFLQWGRHGYDPAGIFFGDGTNLSVLESMPIAAAVAVWPLRYGASAIRTRRREGFSLTTADAFAVVCSLLFVALYLPQLPVKLMVTVRYIHPLYPLLLYAAVRQEWLQTALRTRTRFGLAGYAVTVLVGLPLAVAGLFVTSVTVGTAVQTFGLVALAAAGLVAASGLAGAFEAGDDRATATAAGLAAGVGTVFLLLTALVLMHYGPSALPAVDSVSGDIRFALLRNG
jgi:hypothetical protein